MNDRIQREIGLNPTPDTLSRHLRQSRRGGDLEGVLKACEGLLAAPASPCPRSSYYVSGVDIAQCVDGWIQEPDGGDECEECSGKGVVLGNAPEVRQVREALRRGVDSLKGAPRVACDCDTPPVNVTSDGRYLWCNVCHSPVDDLRPDISDQAARIANLARLLPGPQPMHAVTVEAKGHREGTTRERMIPAPTHALRLYVDALKLAKGEGWFDWLVSTVSDPWMIGFRRGVGSLRWQHNGARILADTTLSCGPECPPLPEVTL